LVLKILREKVLSSKEISEELEQKEISGQLSKVIKKLSEDKLVERTIPDNPNHPNQKHKITDKGILFLKIIENKSTKK
jgi:DNA-binding PadR family transcriptional regulator